MLKSPGRSPIKCDRWLEAPVNDPDSSELAIASQVTSGVYVMTASCSNPSVKEGKSIVEQR